MANSEDDELPPEPLEFITEPEEEPLSFANMDEHDTTITTLDDLVALDQPLDINPATENDPLFDELLPSESESQLPLVEDEDVMDITNERDELSFGNDDEDDSSEKDENPSMYNGSPKENNLTPDSISQEDQIEDEAELDSELIDEPDFEDSGDLSSDISELTEEASEEDVAIPESCVNQCASVQGSKESDDESLPIDEEPEVSSDEDLEEEPEEVAPEETTPSYSLQNLIQSLQDALIAKKYENISELFDVLDELCSYLPESIKDKYLSSLDRLRLEYLRSKMSGKPGLMTIVEELRKKHPEEFADFDETKELTEEMIIKTFIYMNTLTKELPDKNISSLLGKHLDQAIRTIRD